MKDEGLGRGRQRSGSLPGQGTVCRSARPGLRGRGERNAKVEAQPYSLLRHGQELGRGCVGRVGINILE